MHWLYSRCGVSREVVAFNEPFHLRNSPEVLTYNLGIVNLDLAVLFNECDEIDERKTVERANLEKVIVNRGRVAAIAARVVIEKCEYWFW
jgi:hypothetical protein